MISRSGRYAGWGRSALLSFSVCLLNNLTCGQWWIHDLALSSSSSSTWIPHILPSSHLPFFAPITDPSSATRTSVIKNSPEGSYSNIIDDFKGSQKSWNVDCIYENLSLSPELFFFFIRVSAVIVSQLLWETEQTADDPCRQALFHHYHH